MKKLLTFVLAVLMLASLCACGDDGTTPTEAPGPTPNKDGFIFNYKGTELRIHADFAPILAALGEPVRYTESASCAFEGLDKQYGYGSFYLETYPLGDKDYVYGWYFVDDMVENAEGICIGSTKADVEAAYGAENYNGTNAFEVTKGSGKLTVILENDVVTSIQYAIVTD